MRAVGLTPVHLSVTIDRESDLEWAADLLGFSLLNRDEITVDDNGFPQPEEYATHRLVTCNAVLSDFQLDVFNRAAELSGMDERMERMDEPVMRYTETDNTDAGKELLQSRHGRAGWLLSRLVQAMGDRESDVPERFAALAVVERKGGSAKAEHAARYFVLQFQT